MPVVFSRFDHSLSRATDLQASFCSIFASTSFWGSGGADPGTDKSWLQTLVLPWVHSSSSSVTPHHSRSRVRMQGSKSGENESVDPRFVDTSVRSLAQNLVLPWVHSSSSSVTKSRLIQLFIVLMLVKWTTSAWAESRSRFWTSDRTDTSHLSRVSIQQRWTISTKWKDKTVFLSFILKNLTETIWFCSGKSE